MIIPTIRHTRQTIALHVYIRNSLSLLLIKLPRKTRIPRRENRVGTNVNVRYLDVSFSFADLTEYRRVPYYQREFLRASKGDLPESSCTRISNAADQLEDRTQSAWSIVHPYNTRYILRQIRSISPMWKVFPTTDRYMLFYIDSWTRVQAGYLLKAHGRAAR